MLHIALYCDSQSMASQIQSYLDHTDDIREAVHMRAFTSSEDFLKYISGNPYLILMIARSGADGIEVIQKARRINPHARLIWFSKEDCALLSYQFRASYYSEAPMDHNNLYHAFQTICA